MGDVSSSNPKCGVSRLPRIIPYLPSPTVVHTSLPFNDPSKGPTFSITRRQLRKQLFVIYSLIHGTSPYTSKNLIVTTRPTSEIVLKIPPSPAPRTIAECSQQSSEVSCTSVVRRTMVLRTVLQPYYCELLSTQSNSPLSEACFPKVRPLGYVGRLTRLSAHLAAS